LSVYFWLKDHTLTSPKEHALSTQKGYKTQYYDEEREVSCSGEGKGPYFVYTDVVTPILGGTPMLSTVWGKRTSTLMGK
jgi:hypothetical protein